MAMPGTETARRVALASFISTTFDSWLPRSLTKFAAMRRASGKLASQILTCMEPAAAGKTAKVYSRYGSTVHKQVYIYGSLDPRPIELERAFGMAWGRRGLAAVLVPAENRGGRGSEAA